MQNFSKTLILFVIFLLSTSIFYAQNNIVDKEKNDKIENKKTPKAASDILVVATPDYHTINPGQTITILFEVISMSNIEVQNISVSDVIDLGGWTTSILSPTGTFDLPTLYDVQIVTIEVTCPITALEGEIATVTLTGDNGTLDDTDDCLIEVVGTLPSITIQPTDQEVCFENEAVTFTLTAIDETGYQWQEYDGSTWSDLSNIGVYSGAYTNTLTISDVTGLIGYQYRCIVSNDIGSVTSDEVTIIGDTEAPIPDLANLPNLEAVCEISSLTAPTATDNCGGIVTVSHNQTLPITATTTIIWTFEDVNGNQSIQNQDVIIEDLIPPVPDLAVLPDITAECEIASLTEPTATDNCVGVVTVTHDQTLPITTQGTTIVSWTFEDGNGNTYTQTQNVVIDDITPPIPDLAVLPNVTDECEVASLSDPTATDNCGGVVTVTNDASLPITFQGTTVVIWTYDDGNGNTYTQTQNVVIEDITAPVPDLAVLPDVTDECEVASLTDPTATDNCGSIVTVTNDATLPINSQGTTIVTWTYTDENGNSSTQTQNVVIEDITPPVPDLVVLPDVTDECEVSSLTDLTVTDNCGGIVTVTNDASLPITFQGTTVVTWTYDDGNGNTYTQTQNIVIEDITPPVPDLAVFPDVTAECEISTLTNPTATDNCGGLVTVSNDATLPINLQGTTVVIWTFEDENGNTYTQTQNVVIDDITPPVPDLVVLPDVTDECEIVSLTDPTATDNCGGIVTVSNDAVLPITMQGITVVTWTYDDGNGNTYTQTQNVVIDDITAPVPDLAVLPEITDECEIVSLTDPTATDNCGGIVTVSNDTVLPITTQGTTVVTWTYADGNGNQTTQTQNVIIDDITAPIPDLAVQPDVTAECEINSLTDPTATDNCGGIVTVTNNATLPITTQGTTVVTWTFEDVNGNTYTQTQNVVIDDITPPVPDISVLPDETAECEIISLTDPTATDNCGEVVTVTNDASLPITAQGTTIVTWSYTDVNGNTYTQTQNVVIEDITPPVPDLASLPDLQAACEVSSLTIPTGTDNCGGAVTVSHDQTLPIYGTTTINWTYEDEVGNTYTQTQNVIIDDLIPPVPNASSLPDLTDECEIATLTEPTGTDNCGGIVYVTHDQTLPITEQGTTVITWTFADGNGNQAYQTQNVILEDNTAPVPDLAVLPDITAECEVLSLTNPDVTDNCGGLVTITNDAILPITTQGTTIITWTYTDVNGNSSAQTQNVIIDDITAPMPDLAVLPNVTDECEITTLTAPTATDNCGGIVTVTNDASLPISLQGTSVVTWLYSDENGNTYTQTQNIVIDDITAPTPDLSVLPDINAECEVTSLTFPTATDNCGGNVTVTSDATLPITTQGISLIRWTYEDENGNMSTQEQNVIIDDITPPTPELSELPTLTAECEITTLDEPTATDNCGGTYTGTHELTLPITETTTIIWTYKDGRGNIATQEQEVVIEDITAPVPVLSELPDLTAECEIMTLEEPEATDNCIGEIIVTHDQTLPILSTSTILWTYTDETGNFTTQQQQVIIEDITPPEPVLAELPYLAAECEIIELSSPEATDNCSGNVTITHNQILPITSQGTTVVTWTYTDENGNQATQEQNIIIEDVTPPVADETTLNTLSQACSIVVDVVPLAFDNCEGEITGTTNDQLQYLEMGSYNVNWIFTDSKGNLSEYLQTVVVVNDAPIVETQDITVVLDENENATIVPSDIDNGSTDDCGIDSMSLDITDFTYDDLGENTVILTVVDLAGNISTKSAIVTILPPDIPLKFPNYISPNGDGDNDYWEIQGIRKIEGYTLTIFNKLGELVYETDNYDNTWDATYNGTPLPNGTYYYVFKYDKRNIGGFISVVR